MLSRKNFIRSGLISSAGILFTSYNKIPDETIKQLSPDLVKEFVGSAHNKLHHVIELHEQYPTLINADWDWGGGDLKQHLVPQDMLTILI